MSNFLERDSGFGIRFSARGMTLALVVLSVVFFSRLDVAVAQVVLKGGDVHTVAGDVLEEGTVVLEANGTIAAVGTDLEIPEGYEVVDVSGKVVTPGLIEAHSQLGVVEIWAVGGTRDVEAKQGEDLVQAAFRVADGFNPNSIAIPISRTGGVTSAVVAPGGGIVAGQSAWIDLAGEDTFATLVEPSLAFHAVFGESAASITGGSRGDAVLALRELYDDVVFFRDRRELFDENRSRKLTASRLDLLALQDTLDGQKPMVFHANRASDIIAMLDFAKSAGIRPIVAGGAEAWMVADRLAADQVPVIINPMRNLPYRFESLGARADNVVLLHEAGVPVIVASFDSHNARNLRQMAGNAVRAGLPYDAALAAVTKNVATALGLGDRYGSLEPGKIANVVVWSGDPFEMATRVEKVYIQGHAVSLDNRQHQLMLRYRELDRRAEPAALASPDDEKKNRRNEDD